MENLPFYIITSDVSLNILPAAAYLYNKYWQPLQAQKFKILGNHHLAEELPENFEFIKIKNENNLQKWTRYIYDYILTHETAEYFILSLDDFLPNASLNTEMLSQLLSFAKFNPKVGRVALGRLDVEKWDILEQKDSFDLIKLTRDSIYRISCQTSIWNREYFLKYFQNDWTPWQLELVGSKQAKNDGWEIIGTNGNWAFGWMEESALSGRWPGRINILGLWPEDVKYLIDKKIFQPEKLQYGIWYDCKIPFLSRFQSISKKLTKIPKYSEIGFDFKWKMIKPFVRRKTYNRLYFRYRNIYPK